MTLALAVIHTSPIVFPDECMSALDTDLRETCLETIKKFLIEQGNKTAINIEGDYTRASTLNTKRQINLMWTDGHVELKRTNTPIKCKSVQYEKKPLVFYQDRTDKENPKFNVYDGKTEFQMEKEEF